MRRFLPLVFFAAAIANSLAGLWFQAIIDIAMGIVVAEYEYLVTQAHRHGVEAGWMAAKQIHPRTKERQP